MNDRVPPSINADIPDESPNFTRRHRRTVMYYGVVAVVAVAALITAYRMQTQKSVQNAEQAATKNSAKEPISEKEAKRRRQMLFDEDDASAPKKDPVPEKPASASTKLAPPMGGQPGPLAGTPLPPPIDLSRMPMARGTIPVTGAGGNADAAAASVAANVRSSKILVIGGDGVEGAAKGEIAAAVNNTVSELLTRQSDSKQEMLNRVEQLAKPAATSQNREQELRKWAADQARDDSAQEVITPHPSAGRYVIQKGKVIPAVMQQNVTSDLPGEVWAMVTENVYDSIEGDVLLIPKGSRLFGRANADAREGQDRLVVAFNRLYLPSGAFIELGGMNGTDGMGQAGVPGDVNNHFWSQFGSSFLIAGLSNFLGNKNNTTVNVYGNSSGLVDAAGQVMVDVNKKVMEKYTSQAPTIVVKGGTRFRVMVNKDIRLNPA